MSSVEIDAATLAFVTDAFEREHGRRPSDQEELTEWCLIQWSRIRALRNASESSGDVLGHLTKRVAEAFPGMHRHTRGDP